MSIEEFDNAKFSGKSKVEYKGSTYDVYAVEFEEKLIAINQFNYSDSDEDFELQWKRCENVKLINE